MKVFNTVFLSIILSFLTVFDVFAQNQVEVISGQELLLYNKTGASQSSFANAVSNRVRYFGASNGGSQVKLLNKNIATASVGSHGSSFRTANESDLLAACNSIRDNNVGCEINHVYKVSATPNDSSFASLYGMTKIAAQTAWDATTGSNTVGVAVIDTGVDYTHPDLADNILLNTAEIPGNSVDDDANGKVDDYFGYDFFNNDSNPMDDNNHGSHVAGTIGARGNNGIGVVGVNWQVGILPLKVLGAAGSGSTSGIINAIDYAISRGVKVINMSLGGLNRSLLNGANAYSQAFYDCLIRANNAGILVVVAAGNNGLNNDGDPTYPASYNAPNLIAVAATTNTDSLASYSNYGPASVHLAAPGSGILSTTPGNTYSNFSGTSMACPHVAGAAALLLGANPSLSALQLKDILLNNVDFVAGLTGKVATSGRLNIAKAVAAALGAPPPAPTPVPTNPPSSPGDDNGGSPAPVPGEEEPEEPGLVLDYVAVDSTYKNKKVNFVVLALDADDFEVTDANVRVEGPGGKNAKEKSTNEFGEAYFTVKQTNKTQKLTFTVVDSYGTTIKKNVRVRALPRSRR